MPKKSCYRLCLTLILIYLSSIFLKTLQKKNFGGWTGPDSMDFPPGYVHSIRHNRLIYWKEIENRKNVLSKKVGKAIVCKTYVYFCTVTNTYIHI